jgi:gliding motility-associated protein GldL
MNFGEIFKTKRWRTFMGYIYGWGASIVMIGALFKLQHWQYSGLLLTIGLLTEAVIFFLSAFEPPLEIPEWSKVYPELRDDFDMMELDDIRPAGKNGLSQLLASSELTPELLDKVGQSLTELSTTARGISDISSATLATDQYVKNMSTASESMNSLSELNKRANEVVNSSVEKLAQSYSSTSDHIVETGKHSIEKLHKTSEEFSSQLLEAGKKLSDTVNGASNTFTSELKNIGENSKNYSEYLEKLNQNMLTLNENLENQLKQAKVQFDTNQKFSGDLNRINEILSSSVSELQKYKENAEQLNKHLGELNTIYGNMLGAMRYTNK